jgi:cytochrome c oxidase assembly protein subunit 15
VRVPQLSPTTYRAVTLFALAALAVIIVTGAAVRLTGSGLGCPTWPTCETNHLVPHGETGYHGWVEFVNRTFTGLVSIAVAAAALGSLVRVPRRRDLTWLSIALVAGVLAQAVLGGITVKVGLSPPWVMAHLLLSMALVLAAVVLHHRAGEPDGDAAPIVAPEIRTMGRVLVGAAAIVIFTGTIVTGAGPHGGDEDVRRLDFFVPDVARIHGIAENLFLLGVLLTLWLLHRTQAPAVVRRDAQVLLAVLVAQAAVGYAQYFTGVPVLLVGIHVAGATAVWVAVLHFHLSLWRRGLAPAG